MSTNSPSRLTEAQLHHQDSKNSFLGKYLAEFVYGGMDGAVTTFAVVAGATGADYGAAVIIILGLANLIGDGFSMSVGNYLSKKTDLDHYNKNKAVEEREVDHMPAKEKQEIRDIYAAKGFTGNLLEQVVDVITADKKRRVDVMMIEELGLIKDERSPFQTGLATFISFIVVGAIPLIAYAFSYLIPTPLPRLFLLSACMTGVAFIVIGYLKSIVNKTSMLRGISETVLLGSTAAALAYFVGVVFEKIIVGG